MDEHTFKAGDFVRPRYIKPLECHSNLIGIITDSEPRDCSSCNAMGVAYKVFWLCSRNEEPQYYACIAGGGYYHAYALVKVEVPNG